MISVSQRLPSVVCGDKNGKKDVSALVNERMENILSKLKPNPSATKLDKTIEEILDEAR